MAPIRCLRVSPLQCLTSSILFGSPFPSHPTVRSVFPSTTARQPSSQGMHRRSLVPDQPAANVDDSHGIQAFVRIFLPSEPSAFTTIGQVSSKASPCLAFRYRVLCSCRTVFALLLAIRQSIPPQLRRTPPAEAGSLPIGPGFALPTLQAVL